MINLLENLEQEEYLELRRKILSWLRAHPGKKVYLFFNLKRFYLEEIK